MTVTPIPAAQYLRMSTEDQPNSIEIQRDAIQRYASVHGYEVVATYSDPGKSGLYIRNRPGLRRLLRDVLAGDRPFRAILVYDVSRWGRFQDTDESAHYEFLCRRAGAEVQYCAEEFENDNKLQNSIMKALKRTMAAEYSRQLSINISAAHKRMAQKGYHVGGIASYGLRRLLIRANGGTQLLDRGESKVLRSDHVVLVPGPASELACVRTIFKLAANPQNSPRVIAEKLNRAGRSYSDNTPWDPVRVQRVLRNERFRGYTVWGMRTVRFHGPPQPVPRSEWVLKAGAFPAIVNDKEFASAQSNTQTRSHNPGTSTKELLDSFAHSLANGNITSERLRRKFFLLRRRCEQRFGTILKVYELIGYKPSSHVVNSCAARLKIRSLKEGLFAQLTELFPTRVRMVRRFHEQRFRVLELDNCIRIAVHVCRNIMREVSGKRAWLLKIRPKDKPLPALICLPDKNLTRLTDFFFVSDLTSIRNKYKVLREDHPWLSEQNRLLSPRDFCTTAKKVMDGHLPPAALRSNGFYLVGDVLFTEDDSTVIIDGNEIPLSAPTAAIFKMLLQNAGQVVSRNTLTHAQTAPNKELYLNIQISELRKALSDKFRKRIVTVWGKGYMYKKDSVNAYSEISGR